MRQKYPKITNTCGTFRIVQWSFRSLPLISVFLYPQDQTNPLVRHFRTPDLGSRIVFPLKNPRFPNFAPLCKFFRANLPHDLFLFFFWELQTERYRYRLVLKMEILTRKSQRCEFQTSFACFPSPVHLIFLDFLWNWNQATLKPPGFENGNLDRPKRGMLIPNMS